MEGDHESTGTRRAFIRQGGLILGAAALASAAVLGCAQEPANVEVSAAEDLMAEHGVLRRLLLLYDEMARRLECCKELAPEVLPQAATLMHGFVQEHHEKVEEEQVFPLFEKAGKHLALVKILRSQHEAGRRITTYLLHQVASPQSSPNFIQRAQLGAYLHLFTRMYRVHAAREDTVLFPALRAMVPPAQYLALGRTFATQDHDRNGLKSNGGVLAQVVGLEKALGLYDLENVTPRI
jgi:hemerythrin-like domain-containing protein